MNPDEITPPEYRDGAKAKSADRDAAANVIRSKLDAIYGHEPDAKAEAAEVVVIKPDVHLSVHQKFMKSLIDSGNNTAEIQTAWHNYYQNLPEEQKHEVWQEFYSQQADLKKEQQQQAEAERARKAAEIKKTEQDDELVPRARSSVKSRPKKHANPYISASASSFQAVKDNHHVRSLMFGLGMGFTVIFILLFSFFNERFITPFIRPNQNVSATPIIVDPNSAGPVGPESKIIIPKINVEAPVVYDVKTIQENDIQNGLERGVVHYSTTPNPGELGNAVIFGHSSSNILNKGKYKFAFLLLKSLDKDDTFIVQKDSKRYVYKVYNKYVTSPTDFSVLDPSDRPAIITLITCDPPGTSTNRLIIQAEQIFPDPAGNAKSSVPSGNVGQPDQLPSNSISLWQRIKNWF